ncbi:MAG: MFS transporter [Pseudomonadota bacterium]
MEKIPLLLMFLGHVCVDASQGILPVALVKLKDLFALSYFQVGLMTMVLSVSASVIQPIFGYVSDRMYTGWFIPVGILWASLTMGLLGWAPNYPLALLLVGLAGLGTAAFHPRAMMVVYLLSGNRRGLFGAFFFMGGNLGFALGPTLGSFIVVGLGLHATPLLILPGAVLFIIITFYAGDFLKRGAMDRTGLRQGRHEEALPVPWLSLTAVCLIVTLRSWIYMGFITYLPLYLKSRGVPLKIGGLMLTVYLVGGAFAGLYGGYVSDRIGRRKVIAASMLLCPLFTALFITGEGVWLWVLAGASGAALLASFSVTIILAQELLPRHLGLASGLVLGLGFGTGGMGTAFSGYLADKIGLYGSMWVLALAPILGVVLVALIRQETPSADNSSPN